MPQPHVLAIALIAFAVGGCATEELSGPPVNTVELVQREAGDDSTSRSRGVVELYLTPDNPSHTFWNDPATQKVAWGVITLNGVDADGDVIVSFQGKTLRARPGGVFPGTGIQVIVSNPELGTALLRTRWTHTVISK